jgi:hypothetical protein
MGVRPLGLPAPYAEHLCIVLYSLQAKYCPLPLLGETRERHGTGINKY